VKPAAVDESRRDLAVLGSGAMFDKIARRYDFVNRVMSFGMDKGWRRRAVRALQLGERPRVLDVATGTGDLAIDIARTCPGATVVGLDPSRQMLAIAADKIVRRGLADRVSVVEGDAQQLPFASCEFDGATIAFGIRNVPDRDAGLRELARVVRPGGRIAVLELGEPRRGVLGALARVHTHHVLPRIGALLSGSREYAYLQRSMAAFPTPDAFVAQMERAGLHVVETAALAFGACTLFVATPAEDA
jgi:demethylmenaquinone methyltransferase/2-methoxy-6-polyprenyl-1,4-benzoquinol methylase